MELARSRVVRHRHVVLGGLADRHTVGLGYSPDGRLLAVGTDDGKVVLFNAVDGGRSGPIIQAATGVIDPVSFSPDSRLLAASSIDQTATLWDVASRKRLGRTFPVVQGTIPVARFAPNRDLVIVGLADAAIWPMDPQAWKRFACRVAGRDLTRDEWSDALPDRPYRRTCSP